MRNRFRSIKRISLLGIALISQIPFGRSQTAELGIKDAYQRYFPIGVAINPPDILGNCSDLIRSEFNALTPANAMKMGPIHPAADRYNWDPADRIVEFAGTNGMQVHGHVLCWHTQVPAWIFTDAAGDTVSKEVLLQRLKQHIFDVVTRYKGKVAAWDVVNEAIDDAPGQFYRDNAWYRICGPEYIAKAFEYAHEADPQAILYYNDYNTEIPQKRDKVFSLMKQLLDAGVPVNGLGLQGHWSIYEPSEQDLRAALDIYSGLNLKIMITELDVSIYPPEAGSRALKPGEILEFTRDLEAKQVAMYKMCFKVFREYKHVISGVTFWGLSDRQSWLNNFPVRGRTNYPLLFDRELNHKNAYWEVVNF
jgi:endo-1,4-beta-xylanase